MLNRSQAELIAIANDAIKAVRRNIKITSTYPGLHKDEFKQLDAVIISMRQGIFSLDESLFDFYSIPNDLAFRAMKKSIKGSKRFFAANCGEYSYLIVNYLRKLNIKAEIFDIEDGDHWFVVINRAEKSSPRNYLSWGDDAIICDAFHNKVYLANEIPQYFLCFKQDKSLEYPNSVYQYTKESFELVYSPAKHSSETYHRELISEAIVKLGIIKRVVSNVQNTHELVSIIDSLIESVKIIPIDNKSADDIERTTNRYVKNCLKKLLTEGNLNNNQFKYTLINELMVYTLNNSNSEAKLKFKKSLSSHSDEIFDIYLGAIGYK